jgi:tetratricopeptide (TPR) repeat protein
VKRLFFLLIAVGLAANFCTAKHNRVKLEVDFANRLAMTGLWQEAYFRWQKSLAGGESAVLHNNMAIALEYVGKYKEAEQEYLTALKLAPNNNFIKNNLKKVRDILSGKSVEEPNKRQEIRKKGKENEKEK